VQPPLAGVVSACEAINICIAASVGGMHFGSIEPGSAGGSGGLQLEATFWLRSQQSRQLERHTLAVVPGHVSAEAAEPLEDALLSASSSIAGGGEQQLAGLGLGLPGHRLLDDQPAQLPVATGGAGSSSLVADWEQEHGLAAAAAAMPTAAAPHSRASVLDSPSELCRSPQELLARPWLTLAQQQAAASGSGAQLGATTTGAKEGAGDVGTRGRLDAASEAALREAATDFMHPSHWASTRQAAAGAAAADDAGRARSTGSSDAPSFLLPGRHYSSSDGSSEAGGAAGRRRLSQQLDAVLGMPAAAASAAAGLQHPALAAAAASPVAIAAAGGDAPLALYGQADHLLEANRQLTLSERLQLAVRAGQLLALFAPFLLLGTGLLLLAAQVDAAAARRRRQEVAVAAVAGIPLVEVEPSQTASRLRTAAFKLLLGACKRRCASLSLPGWLYMRVNARQFACLPCWPVCWQNTNNLACALLTHPPCLPACSGAAFIKWGQWAATREDIFPQARNKEGGRPEMIACMHHRPRLSPIQLCPPADMPSCQT
jgi:hypothetical protein